MPRVSVIIPCYNQGAWLDEAIDSVLAQTFGDIEIVVVNDGSTDDATVKLLERYSRPKTRVIHTANQGLPSARNNGIREAQGDYILPLDADDRIAPTYLEKAVAILDREPEMGIVYCYGELFGAETGRIAAPDFSVRKMLLSNLVFCSALFRRSDWEQVGGYNPLMVHGCEDWDFWLSIIETGRMVVRIPEHLFFYRAKEKSMNREMDVPKRIAMHHQIMRNHKDLYIDHAEPLLALYYRLTNSHFYRLLKSTGLLKRL